jgi:hypothetical protein
MARSEAMHFARWATLVGFWAALLLGAAAEATTSTWPNYGRCENCGASGAFNASGPGAVVTIDGTRRYVINAAGPVGMQNVANDRKVLNSDPAYLFLATLQGGHKAWVLNVLRRHPEPQASRTLRRYY